MSLPPYTYPGSELDQAQVLLGFLGSFWQNSYAGNSVVADILYAQAQLEAQQHLTLLETLAALSRFDVPVFHTDNWYFLQFRESERNSAAVAVPDYGDAGVTYADGDSYGTPRTLGNIFSAPAGLASAPLILNRITAPSVTLTEGIDYSLDRRRGTISFVTNPFDNPLIAKRTIFINGVAADREIGLWVFHGKFDLAQIYAQFGYVLGLKLASSEGYRSLLNAIFDALIEGTTARQVEQALSALAGIPLVQEQQETVETIINDTRRLLIVTDQHVYAFPPAAVPLVAVGDSVSAGQSLTDALQFYEFNSGQLSNDLRALSVGSGFLGYGYYQDLTFENKTVPLVVETDSDGFTRVSFEVSGFPLDVEKFWDDVHQVGLARGQTLAHLLDRRVNKEGEPTAAWLPETVNPLLFLIQNFFRNSVCVARLKTSLQGSESLHMAGVHLLKKIIPPQTALILLFEYVVTESPLVLAQAGSDTIAGYTETVGQYQGFNPIQENLSSDVYATEGPVTIRQMAGRCQ